MSERVLAAIAAVVIGAAAAIAGWVVYGTPGSVFDDEPPDAVSVDVEDGEAVLFTVEPGMSADLIGAGLADLGVIESGRHFEVLVALTGVSDSLAAGDYEFEPDTPAIEAVWRIANGRTASNEVTFPEGLRAEEIGEILERERIVTRDEFLAALVKEEYGEPFLERYDAPGLEGFLFPARYEFNRETDAGQVVATMLRAFQDNVAEDLQLEGQELTLYEVVTLASIVEREAATAEERPIIASVFRNRLRIGIMLQADPTVQYALASDPANVEQFGWWKRGLTLDDLTFDSAYNTYVYAGLPPGPIANPGLDAMLAVIRPAQTNYLYFVAKDDGTHVFAETLEEHLQNVQQYQPQ